MNKLREWMLAGLRAFATDFTGKSAPWKAKSVWVAAVMAMLGTGFWRHGEPAPQPPPAPAQEQIATAAAEAQPPAPEAQATGPASSAAVTLGVSYIGGYFLGWCYRRFVKLSVALTGGVLAALAVVKSLGWFESDVTALESHVREGSAWLSQQAGALNDYLTGLLPSAGATGFGAFRGFRRKRTPAGAAAVPPKPA